MAAAATLSIAPNSSLALASRRGSSDSPETAPRNKSTPARMIASCARSTASDNFAICVSKIEPELSPTSSALTPPVLFTPRAYKRTYSNSSARSCNAALNANAMLAERIAVHMGGISICIIAASASPPPPVLFLFLAATHLAASTALLLALSTARSSASTNHSAAIASSMTFRTSSAIASIKGSSTCRTNFNCAPTCFILHTASSTLATPAKNLSCL
mmetsp:Transcript_10388/g.21881  ORF Transcript_10388/g.21881 Transcript_10388/m.21881 type:complete len:217 (-) Transcript_10388:1065-1715(-)